METGKHIFRTASYRVAVQGRFKRLGVLRLKEDPKAFYAVFIQTMPELRKYINSRLQTLVGSGVLMSNFYKEDDFIDDLFIRAYNRFNSFESDDEFYVFLFVTLNTLLEQAVATEQKVHESTENIADFEKAERDSMREQLATQLDGDIIFKEELDDVSYQKEKETFASLFELNTVKDLDNRIDKERMHTWTSEQIDGFIKTLPNAHKNIAILYLHFHLTRPEIQKITKQSAVQVDKVITILQESLTEILFNN